MLMIMLFLTACSDPESDEAQIKNQIDSLQQAIEAHDRGDFMALVDADYHDQMNNNRKKLEAILLGYFLRYKDISILISATSVEVTQIRAEAHSQVVISGGRGVIPESARHYRVQSCWKKVDDEWLLSCLKWR
jgi:hypothetical protein